MFNRAFFIALLCLTCFANDDAADNLNHAFSNSITEFSLNLLRVLSQLGENNVLFSPTSIDILLSQLQQGSVGRTATELAQVLGRDYIMSQSAYAEMGNALSKDENNGVTMSLASRMFLRPDFILNETFQKILAQNFQSAPETLDFGNSEAANHINKWVAEATKNQINDLVSKDAVTAETLMVLASAMFFKGQWKLPFRRGRKTSGKFFPSPGRSVEVQYMYATRRFHGGEDRNLNFKWVQLPYRDEKYSMLVILPNADNGLNELLAKMTGEYLLNIASNIDNFRHVRIQMPIFSLKSKTNLQTPLKQLGLQSMFGNNAEMPFIGTGSLPLKVSDVMHGALLEVNEEGTKASAGTGIVLTPLSLNERDDDMQFIVNRPFLVFIMDRGRKIPHFVSKVVNPSVKA